MAGVTKRSGRETGLQVLQTQFFEHLLQTLAGASSGTVAEAIGLDFSRQNEFVLHRMFPTDQFGHRSLVAMGFELQAAQDVGDLTAEFARV
jgi:hypothetical protein